MFYGIVAYMSIMAPAMGGTPEPLSLQTAPNAPWPAYESRPLSLSLYGQPGFLTVPNARMDDPGMMRVGLSTLDPYLHGYIGFQIAKPLYISLRQSAAVSGLNADPDRLYPGVDLKLRLYEETQHVPEISIGLQSALGHKRMAGEYLALSKSYRDFDLSGGLAWGRLGSAGHIKNPLGLLGGHFNKTRSLDGEQPNEIRHWFTGKEIGLFAGLEYRTPVDGLSLKAEWGADRYKAEAAFDDYNAPSPWAIGASYAPTDWISLSGALVGGEKVMAGLNLHSPGSRWPKRQNTPDQLPSLEATYHTENRTAYAILNTDEQSSLPAQFGRVAREINRQAEPHIEALDIGTRLYGLHGPSVHLIRADLERTLASNQGSAAELWHNTGLRPAKSEDDGEKLSPPPIKHSRLRDLRVHLTLDHSASLSEEDSGLLYRTRLLIEKREHLTRHLIAGTELGLSLANNLEKLVDLRPRALTPVRSDVDIFAQRGLSLDRLYVSWLATPFKDTHIVLTSGYLEEMYGGAGGEVLYRPFGKTYALGAEFYRVLKRSPYADLNQALIGDPVFTGFLKGWYEFPRSDLTAHARIGRYLGGDTGGTLSLSRRFQNGMYLEAFTTATNNADFDLFGGTTHLYSGINLTLPLGPIPHITETSTVALHFAPFGRDTGQTLAPPVSLYDMTDPLSLRQISRNWEDITH